MPNYSVGNWIRENSSSQGTGNLTLTGAVGNNPTFLSVFGSGLTSKIPYAILNNGVQVEAGLCDFNGTLNEVARAPTATWVGGVYTTGAPAPVNLVGPVEIHVTVNSAQYGSIVEEAPSDGQLYARVDDSWSLIPVGAIAQWLFSTSTAASDPGAGNLRFNQASFAATTQIYFSSLSEGGINKNGLLEGLVDGQRIKIREQSDADRSGVYLVEGSPIPDVAMPGTNWWTVNVQFVDEGFGGFLRNNRSLLVEFIGMGGGGVSFADAVFPTYAVFDELVIADSGTIDFSLGNNQQVDAATYPAILVTGPPGKPAHYTLTILNAESMTSFGPSIGGNMRYGEGGMPNWNGRCEVSVYYNGTDWTVTAIVNTSEQAV